MFRMTGVVAVVVGMLMAQEAEALELFVADRGRIEPVVTDELAGRMAGTSAIPVWIAFTDKGVGAVPSLDGIASVRAGERRARRGGEPSLADLPLVEMYIESVTAVGVDIRHRSRWFNAVSAWATPVEILDLARLPFVAEVSPVRGRVARDPLDDADSADSSDTDDRSHPGSLSGDATEADRRFYGFDPIGYGRSQIVDAHRAGYTGTGVLIAVFDSGFYSDHDVFRDVPIIAERDFVQGDGNTADDATRTPPDMNDGRGNASMCHGTATWSIAGGYLPGKRVGVAFGSEFAVAKTEYPPYERHVEEDNWVAAAEWADSLGADIITSSLGYSTFDTGEGDYTYEDTDGRTTIVTQAANMATINGILVVNSAGNGGQAARSITAPGDSDSVLTVGAVKCGTGGSICSEQLSDFSSRGPVAPAPPSKQERIKPDVLAQGERVPAATSEGCYDPNPSSGNFHDDGDPFYDLEDVQGTSFACPMTAGAAALVLEAHPLWRPHVVRHAFQTTASEFAQGIEPSTSRGYGVIRLMDAMSIVGFGVRQLPLRPGPFDPVSPESFSVSTQPVPDHPPTFEWTVPALGRSQQPITYTLQLDADGRFDNPTTFSALDAPTLTLADDPVEGFYNWRVLASDGSEVRELRQRPRILIDHVPSPAVLTLPADSVEVDVLTPTFAWEASADDSPKEVLEYWVTLVANGKTTVYPATTALSYTLPADDPAHEGAVHSWFVTTSDRFGIRATSTERRFEVGLFPPSAFTVTSPATDGTVATRRPTLSWSPAIDPNPDDRISYQVLWGPTPDAISQVLIQDISFTEFRVSSALRFDDNDVVYWQVEARDTFGSRVTSDVGSFRVELAPQPFELATPSRDAVVFGGATVFSWAEPVDESVDDSFRYLISVSTDSLATDIVAEQSGLTSTQTTLDANLPEDERLWWRVLATDEQDRSTWSAARPFMYSAAPSAFLVTSFPNPFTAAGALTVRYGVPAGADGSPLHIRVFDGTGRVVRTLASGTAQAGSEFSVEWDGRDTAGQRSSPGVYFVAVLVGSDERVHKVIYLGATSN